MKFDIITASYNSGKTISNCFNSIQKQNYLKDEITWLLCDGASVDKTISIVEEIDTNIKIKIISEKDNGLYYAYNKGLHKTIIEPHETIVNFLDSDNEYVSDDVLFKVNMIFEKVKADVIFSDLIYVNADGKLIRQWCSKPDKNHFEKIDNFYVYKNFNFRDHILGWSMPLPTIFIKKSFLQKIGAFDTEYNICSDYDWSMRITNNKNLTAVYVPEIFVKMKLGGVSNKFSNLLKIKVQDYKIIKKLYKTSNTFDYAILPIITLILKNIRKIPQFFIKG